MADSSTQITLTWSAATDNVAVTGYTLYRDSQNIITTANTSFSDVNLAPNTAYMYSVKAHDGSGNESPLSAEVPVTTLPDPQSTPPPSAPIIQQAQVDSDTQITVSWLPGLESETISAGVSPFRIIGGAQNCPVWP